MAYCIHSESTFGWLVVTGILPKQLLIMLSVEQPKCLGDFHMLCHDNAGVLPTECIAAAAHLLSYLTYLSPVNMSSLV